jgi:hypothetical protein
VAPVIESIRQVEARSAVWTRAFAAGLTPATVVATVVPSTFEALENRRMMSVSGSVTLNNGILTITGDPTVACSMYAELASTTTITGSADNNHRITVPLSAVKGIDIVGGSGNNIIYVDTQVTIPTTITVGGGNDVIRGGGGYSAIYAGNGNNWISTRGTGDYVSVGNGNNYVLGGNGNDTIVAGNGNDFLEGWLGNDSISAGSGQDTLVGDAGNDTLSSGNGNDSVSGGTDNDNIAVGTGIDVVNAGSGVNTVTLNGTRTTIQAAPGQTTVLNHSGGSVASSSTQLPTNTTTTTTTTTTAPAATTVTPPTTTTTTGTTPPVNLNWSTFAAGKPASSNLPEAELQLLAPVKQVGVAISVNALQSVLGVGTPIDANYAWNFGDPTGQYNTLNGFNANHIYENAGTYTITLTVTNNQWKSSTVSAQVTIAPDLRKSIYVNAATGNDANSGSTPGSAVKTAARADQLLGNNTNVYFAAGQEFNVSSTFTVWHSNVVIGSYGSGAQPVLNYTAPAASSVIISADSQVSQDITIQGLTFTTLNGTEPTLGDMPMAIKTGGYDVSAVNDTFRYCEYAIDANSIPTGMSVINCSAPLTNGIQGYFVWDQGSDNMVIGNTVADVVDEHVLRSSGTTVQLIADNNFTNTDGKGCIEVHEGTFAWVQGNTVTGGDIRVGPLGLWGEPVTSNTTDCVIQGNTLVGTPINVFPGSHDISIRSNVIKLSGEAMINVMGQDSSGRQSIDIRILNNTGISTGTAGQFLQVSSYTDGITLENNLLDEPNMITGSGETAPVLVSLANLDSFTAISNNVWQLPKTIYAFADGGINFVGTAYVSSGYLTATAWNNLAQVGTDLFSSTAISGIIPASNSVAATAGVPLSGVFYDINGKGVPSSGPWSAGAVQVN